MNVETNSKALADTLMQTSSILLNELLSERGIKLIETYTKVVRLYNIKLQQAGFSEEEAMNLTEVFELDALFNSIS